MSNTKKLSRYPGARPFEQKQSNLFFGRENDINALYRLIKLRSVVTLYGKSGTGKSSLLNAGIIPKTLEDRRFVPLVVRFNSFNKDGDTNMMPFETTQLAIRGGKKSAKTFLDRLIKDEDSLWHDVKEHYLRHKGERGLLLIFDQFEELFTYDDRAINFFQEELAEALYTDVPQRYWDALKREQDKGNEPLSNEELELMQQPPQVKILISIRADRLHLLSRLDDYLPNILKNNYELDALDTDSATDAIVSPAALPDEKKVYDTPSFAFEPKALKNIVDFLTKDGTEKIESTQLQIICNAIQKRVLADKLSLVKADDIGDLKAIIGNFYADNIAALPLDEQQPARLLIEDHLIFEEEERRLPLYEGKVLKLVSAKTLASLVDNHLLRAEPSMQGGYTYELSHDTLVTPVLQARAKRVKAEREAEEARLSALRDAELMESKRLHDIERGKRQRSNILAVCAMLGFLVASFAGWKAVQNSKLASSQRDSLMTQADLMKRQNDSIISQKDALALQNDAIAAQKDSINKLFIAKLLSDKSLSVAQRERIVSFQVAAEKSEEAAKNKLEKERAQQEAKENAEKAREESEKATRLAGNLEVKTKELEDTTKVLQFTRDSANTLANKIKEALERANNTEAERKKLQEQYDAAIKTSQEAERAIRNKLNETIATKNKLAETNDHIKALRQREIDLNRTLADKNAQLQKAENDLAIANNKANALAESYKQQLNSTKNQLDEATNQQNKSIANLIALQNEVRIANQARQQAQVDAEQARKDLVNKSSEVERLKIELASSQTSKSSTDVTALQLKESELTKARADLQQAQKDVAALDAELTRLKADLTEDNKKTPQYAEQIQKKENELTASEAEVKRLNQALLDTKTANTTMLQNKDADLRKKEQDLKEAKDKLNAATATANKAQSDLDAKQKALENCQKDLTAALNKPTTPPSVSSGFEPQMVAIKGGTFQMGSPESETDRSDNETQHTVTVSNFSMGKYEVTVRQYLQFCTETNTNLPEWLEKGNKYHVETGSDTYYKDKGYRRTGSENLPIVGVSWNDATAYAQWLSKKTGKNYRLPTEAEWEYACRAGTKTPFNTGENLTTDQANYNGEYPYKNFPKGKHREKTTPVGSFAPNAWGLYDMQGNVLEWCSDWYDKDYYKNSPTQDPKGPATSPYSFRVLRGGSWTYHGQYCRSSFRDAITPDYRSNDLGFRLVFVP